MDYKSILVEIGADVGCRDRLRSATMFAFKFGAHLTGISATGFPLAHHRGAEDGARLAALAHAKIRAQALGHADLMRDIMAETGHAVSWSHEIVEDDPAPAIIRMSAVADVIVLARHSTWLGMSPAAGDPAEAILLRSGRPAIIIPPSTTLHVGGHSMIAWNDSPEAARAVADALPLLNAASLVTVATDAADESVDNILNYLTSHGIHPNVQRISDGEDAGDALMRTARLNAVDIIVAGCYGHSRIREFAFGGASRTLLQWARIPLFMSH